MITMSLRNVWAHKRRLAGTVVAVLLGVAFLSGTLILGATLDASFGDLVDEATAGDAVVRDPTTLAGERLNTFEQTGLVDGSLVDEVAGLDGVAAAAPYVEGQAAVLDQDGEEVGGGGADRLGANWVDDPALNPYRLAAGRGPRDDDEVVLNVGAADDAGLEVGDRATVHVPTPLEVTVVGLATFGDEDGLAGTTFTAFTLEAGQQHFAGGEDRLSRVLVDADPGLSQEQLVAAIEPSLPDGVEAITGAALTDENQQELDDLLRPMRTLLVAFAGIALFVATFGIHNTFAIVLAQRAREIGLLRSVGAERRQVMLAVVVEALVVGLLASALGTLAGLGVAGLLMAMFASFGFALPGGGLEITGITLVMPLVAGVLATLAAAVLPTRRAARVSPMAALRDAALDRTGTSRRRAVGGAAILAVGATVVLVGITTGETAPPEGGRLFQTLGAVALTAVGTLVCLTGVVIVGPVVAGRAVGLLATPVARLRGLGGSLARRNAMRNPRRTASTASALMVGVAVVSMFTVVAASLKAYVDETVDTAFTGDLVIISDNFSGVGLSPDLASAVAELPEVEVATGLGNAPLRLDGEDTLTTPTNGSELAQVMDLDVQEGALEDLADGTMAVSETRAEDEGWTLGTEVPVAFADGATQTLRVAAIYAGDDLVGPVLISQDTWAPHALQQDDSVVVIGLADGVSLADGEAAVQALADQHMAPDVQTQDEYVASVAAEVDQLLAIIYVLLLLAIIIALMGIANTLSLSIHERTRELGLLRAVGQSRSQLRSMVRGEALIVSTFGTVGGVGLGCFLGWALVKSIGEEIDAFAIPVGQLAVVLVVGAIVGLLAAWRPSRRAAKLDVLGAIATS